MRGFLFSLAFIGLVILAFNPRLVVQIQNRFGFTSETATIPAPVSVKREPDDEDISKVQEDENARDEITAPDIAAAPIDIIDEIDITEIIEPEIIPLPAEIIKEETPKEETPNITPAAPEIPRTPLLKTKEPDPENLPRIAGFEDIPKNDDWIGKTPCGVDVFAPPLTLPGLSAREDGGLLTDVIKTNGGQDITNRNTFLYKSPSGVTLRLVDPLVQYYQVTGRDFRAAQEDIFDRKPLESANGSSPEGDGSEDNQQRVTTLANIASPTNLAYMVYGSGEQYRVVTEDIVLTTAYLVTLPRWVNYSAASTEDKRMWDDQICNASHHELGHLRIRLDILAQTLEGYNGFPVGQPKTELMRLMEIYQIEVNELIQDRQDAYHVYNGGGLRRGMIELPYAELPFPWLETASAEIQ